MKVELTNITPNAEAHCEKAARDCYDSISKMKDTNVATNLLKSCTKADHLTINGHASATFRITEVSRSLMSQITRHRIACFSVRSTRYVKEDSFEFVTPPKIRDNFPASVIYQKIMGDIQKAYDMLLFFGAPKEDCKYVLPQGLHTTINMTMSFEGWLHYLRRRMDKKSQWEIRELAYQQYELLKQHAPKIFNKETLLAKRTINIDEDRL